MLSVSALSTYMYCKRKLYLQNVLGFYEPPKEALVKGAIRHLAYEKINLVEEELVKNIKKEITLDVLKGRYHQRYREILLEIIKQKKEGLKQFNILPQDLFKQTWPLILTESETRATIVHDFILKHKVFGKELWEKLTPKIKSEYKIISKRLALKGVIDQIEIYEKGFVPIELKTGSCPKEGVWPNHKIQLAAYALLLEDNLNITVKEGFVAYLDAKQRRHVSINPFLRQEILDLIDKVGSLLKNEKVPDFEKNENKCNKCGIKNMCYNQKIIDKRIKEVTENKKHYI